MCPRQLYQILALLLLHNVHCQMDSSDATVPDLMDICPDTCPWSRGQSRTADSDHWCSGVDFPELPYETKLPQLKYVTLNSSVFYLREDKKLVLNKNGVPINQKQYQLSDDGKTANISYYLSPQLQNCNLKLLDRRLYAYEEPLLALKNCRTKEVIALGDFYEFPDSKAIVACSDAFGYHLGLQPRCEYISLGPSEYEFLDQNTTIRMLPSNRIIHQALYGPEKNSSNIKLCFPLSVVMTKCDQYKIYPHEYRLGTDYRVYVLRISKHLNLGEYKTFPKDNVVQYCIPEDGKDLVYYYFNIIQIISAFFIILAIVIHLLVPSINYHAKPLVCQMFSMAVWFIAGPYRFLWYPETEVGCYVVFFFFYISALTSFFWLNVLAFDLWSIFANLQTSSMQLCANMCDKKPKFLLYCVYAYAIPLLMTILSLVLERQPSMQDALGLHPDITARCWFWEAKSLYLFYSGPIFFLLCVNMVFFGLTLCNLRRASEGVGMVNKKRNKQLFLVCIKIFVIMGLCWIIEFITFLADWRGPASYPALIAMSIQGILLFIIYICKPSTYRILRRKVKGTMSSKSNKPKVSSSPTGAGHSNSTSSGISMESVLNSESGKEESPR